MKKALRGYILTNDRIVLTYKGAVHEILSSDATKFTALSLALTYQGSDSQLDAILGISGNGPPQLPLATWSKVDSSDYCYNGRVVPRPISAYIEFLKERDFPLTDLDAFMQRLDLNPSFRVRNQLFTALRTAGFTLVSTGQIVGFVKVARTMVGAAHPRVFSCARNDVNDDPAGTPAPEHLVHARPDTGDAEHLYVTCLLSPQDVVAILGQAPDVQLAVCSYEVPDQSDVDTRIALESPCSVMPPAFQVYVLRCSATASANDAELFAPLADEQYTTDEDALLAAVPFASELSENTALVVRNRAGKEFHRLSSGSTTA